MLLAQARATKHGTNLNTFLNICNILQQNIVFFNKTGMIMEKT